jgi:hypothetical protein
MPTRASTQYRQAGPRQDRPARAAGDSYPTIGGAFRELTAEIGPTTIVAVDGTLDQLPSGMIVVVGAKSKEGAYRLSS